MGCSVFKTLYIIKTVVAGCIADAVETGYNLKTVYKEKYKKKK